MKVLVVDKKNGSMYQKGDDGVNIGSQYWCGIVQDVVSDREDLGKAWAIKQDIGNLNNLSQQLHVHNGDSLLEYGNQIFVLSTRTTTDQMVKEWDDLVGENTNKAEDLRAVVDQEWDDFFDQLDYGISVGLQEVQDLSAVFFEEWQY